MWFAGMVATALAADGPREFRCDPGGSVRVEGSEFAAEVRGACAMVEVIGQWLTVNVERAAVVTVVGGDNQVAALVYDVSVTVIGTQNVVRAPGLRQVTVTGPNNEVTWWRGRSPRPVREGRRRNRLRGVSWADAWG